MPLKNCKKTNSNESFVSSSVTPYWHPVAAIGKRKLMLSGIWFK